MAVSHDRPTCKQINTIALQFTRTRPCKDIFTAISISLYQAMDNRKQSANSLYFIYYDCAGIAPSIDNLNQSFRIGFQTCF